MKVSTGLAGEMVPFNGTVSGHVISITPLDECHIITDVVNGGNATQLGRFRADGTGRDAPASSIPSFFATLLELLGVVTAEASLRPLEALSGLRSARFSKYPAAEVARFYATTGVANAANPVAA